MSVLRGFGRPSYLTTHALQSAYHQLSQKPLHHPGYEKDVHEVLKRYETSMKFMLPKDGLLFEDTDMRRYLDLFHLPFPSVVLEYTGTSGHYRSVDAQGQPQDLDIVVLAYEDMDKMPGLRKGIAVSCIYHARGMDWLLLPGTLWVPEGITAEQLVRGQDTDVGCLFRTWHNMPEGLNTDEQVKPYGNILLRESLGLMQFCSALNCRNVRGDRVPAPRFINSKRTAKGELPLYEYHVLTVDARERTEQGEAQGGTHASPRQHLRRGHIRRYQSGITIWINSMIVGRKELGVVKKDYRVKETHT